MLITQLKLKQLFLAAKKISNNITVIFQPHRYSRTKILMNEFVSVLSIIKNLYILKTYPAGEKLIEGATAKNLFLNLSKKNKNTIYVDKESLLVKHLNKHTSHKQLIIFMGAGSISKMAYNFIKE